MNSQVPLVSVWIITYNQEKFISQCIEGVLMQKVDFPFEIVIGEDCSTDKTREICLYYQKRFPDIIRVIENKVNLGFVKNWINTLKACNGKYIAMCEGDDYWIDPLKLQKQVDFLEANQDYSACFHNVNYVADNGDFIKLFHEKELPLDFGFEESIRGWFIHTNSICFRRDEQVILEHEGLKQINTLSADRFLVGLLADKGRIRYIPKVMSAYRRHPESAISKSDGIRIINSNINVFLRLKRVLKKQRKNDLNDQLFRLYGQRSLHLFRQKCYPKYFTSLIYSLFFVRNLNNFKGFLKIFLLQLN